MQATVDDQGRVEIPRELRERLHLTPGDVVDLTVVDSTLSLAPVSVGGGGHHPDAKLVRDGTLLLLVGSQALTLDDANRALESGRREHLGLSDDETVETR